MKKRKNAALKAQQKRAHPVKVSEQVPKPVGRIS